MNNEFDDFLDYISELNINQSEYKALAEYVNNLLSRIEALIDSRNFYKSRAEAAEKDLNTLLMEGTASCDFCAKCGKYTWTKEQSTYCPAA